MKFYSVLASLLLVASTSFAQQQAAAEPGGAFILSTNVGVFSQQSTEGTSESKLSVTNGDVNLGYLFSSGFYLGAFYGSKNQETDSTKPRGSHYGGSLGIYSGGWFLNGHYLTGGTLEKTSTDTSWEEGSGYQVDLGYQMRVAGHFFVGLQLSHRSLTYEKKLVDEVEVIGDNLELSDLYPAIRITFIW